MREREGSLIKDKIVLFQVKSKAHKKKKDSACSKLITDEQQLINSQMK